MQDGSWKIEGCDYDDVKALADALEIGEIMASILVRRGYREVAAARAFVNGEIEPHDPFLLGDMAVAVDRIRAAIADGKRICVHGDYDVDGICATALAVLTLRKLGADVEWHLPSRFEEGYGGWPTRAAASCSPSTAALRRSRRSPRRRRAASR
jgi:single-stranded-DNA-specific exonuclease